MPHPNRAMDDELERDRLADEEDMAYEERQALWASLDLSIAQHERGDRLRDAREAIAEMRSQTGSSPSDREERE